MKRIIHSLCLGVGAGVSIGLGGFLFLLSVTYFKFGKICGALLFPIGLMIICFTGLYLYTGKIGFFRNIDKDIMRLNKLDLFYMIIGNLIGAVLLGYFLRLCFTGNSVFLEKCLSVATSKYENKSFLLALGSSVICGVCVYSAVSGFKNATHLPTKILFIEFFIGLFVYCGFDHCVADMFYFSISNSWNSESILWTLICIVGNSCGSILIDDLIHSQIFLNNLK